MPVFIDILKAVLLGITEGLTEFIPVSSTAHLLLLSWVLNFDAIKNNLFEVAIQFSAILAVCVVYRRKIFLLIRRFRKADSQLFILNLIISFLPAAIAGILLHDFIKNVLFSPFVIAIALILGGFVMIYVESKEIQPTTLRTDRITKKQALALGIFQALAIVPGVSRSGATIIGGLILGLSRRAATEFSFFMSIIVISAASFYDLYKNYESLTVSDLNLLLVGFLASFLSSIAVIRWFINFVSKNDFVSFGIYRVMFGSVLLFIIL